MATDFRLTTDAARRAWEDAFHDALLARIPLNKDIMSTDQQIESELQAKGKTAPRVTPADVEAEIASEHYFTAAEGVKGMDWDVHLNSPACYDDVHPLHLLTFCVLVLRNGFTVTGESACASPENFDAEIGRAIARQKAIEKVWPLLGFRLRDTLSSVPTLAAGQPHNPPRPLGHHPVA